MASINGFSEPFQTTTTSNRESDPSGLTMAELRRELQPVQQGTQIMDYIRQGDELQREYGTTGSVDNLQKAQKAYEEGLESSNDPYLRAVCLNNMGSALESLFDETDSMDYLNQAVDSKKQAVDLIPV